MEFILQTDLQAFPAVIEYNHEELKTELKKQVEKYNSIVVTEDTIKESKADKAKLNYLKAALEDKRKEVKKQCLQPYENFEKNIKELVALIDAPIRAIDSQLKEIDNKKKQEKLKEIQKIYQDSIGIFEELVPFKKVYHSKWLNSTYKLSEITLEMQEVRENLENGLQIIEGLNSEFKEQIKDKFFETLDISKALLEDARLKTFKEKQKIIEEQKTKQAQKFLQEKEQEKARESQEEQKKQEEQKQTVHLQVLDFRVWVTPQQMRLLQEFLIKNNIKYGRVE